MFNDDTTEGGGGRGNSDYKEVIEQGVHESVYGRYKDIENLGSDVVFDQNTQYRNSIRLQKDRI